MNLKTQVVGINRLLSDMYQKQMRLSYLLAELDFSEEEIEQLQHYFLADVVAIFLTTLDLVITSIEIEQLRLVLEIYGLSSGFVPNHCNREIGTIEHGFLSSLKTANCKTQLELEFKARIRQLIAAEQADEEIRLSYLHNSAENLCKYSLEIFTSLEGKQYLTISDRNHQISIPQVELLNFYRQLTDTVKLLQQQTQSHTYEKIRRTYKKAYTPWTKEEEEILIGNFELGLNIQEIAQLLERQPGAIASRINKLNLRT